ncbi:MAG: hypothetical protein WA110_03875 [Anaerolineaceae bacterium]
MNPQKASLMQDGYMFQVVPRFSPNDIPQNGFQTVVKIVLIGDWAKTKNLETPPCNLSLHFVKACELMALLVEAEDYSLLPLDQKISDFVQNQAGCHKLIFDRAHA